MERRMSASQPIITPSGDITTDEDTRFRSQSVNLNDIATAITTEVEGDKKGVERSSSTTHVDNSDENAKSHIEVEDDLPGVSGIEPSKSHTSLNGSQKDIRRNSQRSSKSNITTSRKNSLKGSQESVLSKRVVNIIPEEDVSGQQATNVVADDSQRDTANEKEEVVDDDVIANMNIEEEEEKSPSDLQREEFKRWIDHGAAEHHQDDQVPHQGDENAFDMFDNTFMIDESLKKYIQPSYITSNMLNNIISLNEHSTHINPMYNRSRRYDQTSGRYRIGPAFVTKDKLESFNLKKPGKLKLMDDDNFMKNHGFGLLTYFASLADKPHIQNIDLDFVKSIIDAGVDINSRDVYGQTILHAIVRDWHADVVLFAIKHKAEVNVQDDYGRTPLHLAGALNCVEVASVLLRKGADPNIATFKELQTPVHYAAKYNAKDVLKEVVKYGGSICNKDYFERTPLFLAAEKSSEETAKFLLGVGAPSAMFDKLGNSLVGYLIEKIPRIASHALDQHIIRKDMHLKTLIYLNSLETKATIQEERVVVKSPLELIARFNVREVVMHPVIQKAIDVKWNLLGKRDTIKELILLFTCMISWTVITYTLSDDVDYYRTHDGEWSVHAWKIPFEFILVALQMYFFFLSSYRLKGHVKEHSRWTAWKKESLRAQYIHCHPAWPWERESLAAEEESLASLPAASSKLSFWYVYECLVLALFIAVIVSRVFVLIIPSSIALLLLHKVSLGVTFIVTCIRLLKIGTRFRLVSVFFKICFNILKTLIQVAFIYIQLYIPFVALFWNVNSEYVLFILEDPTDPSTQRNVTMQVPLGEVFGHLYQGMFTHKSATFSLPLEAWYRHEVFSFYSIYHLFFTVIFASVLIASVHSTYVIHNADARADASIQTADYLEDLVKKLHPREKEKMEHYYRMNCNPLIVSCRNPLTAERNERDTNSKLASLLMQLERITEIVKDMEKNAPKKLGIYSTPVYYDIIRNSVHFRNILDEFQKKEVKDRARFEKRSETLYNTIPKVCKM